MDRQSGRAERKRKHYYVDETEDPTLFGAGGKVLVGSEGCSRFFTLGLADVEDPTSLAAEVGELGEMASVFASILLDQPGYR